MGNALWRAGRRTVRRAICADSAGNRCAIPIRAAAVHTAASLRPANVWAGVSTARLWTAASVFATALRARAGLRAVAERGTTGAIGGADCALSGCAGGAGAGRVHLLGPGAAGRWLGAAAGQRLAVPDCRRSGRAELGPQREGADGVSAGAGGDGPQYPVDRCAGQRLLQPAAGRAGSDPGDAAARADGREPREYSAGTGELRPGRD